MSRRKVYFVNNRIYHVINRGIMSQPIFVSEKDYQRGIDTILYYQNKNTPLSFGHLLKLPPKERKSILKKLKKERNYLIEIIAFCLMPSHFHILLRQLKNNGISTFVQNFTNSYARYFNILNERTGPIFQGRFKAIMIETDEQLLHVSRYIHLNPYSSAIIKKAIQLKYYPYSSFGEYLGIRNSNYCNKRLILKHFENSAEYDNFVYDNADYQRSLQYIKHSILE